jgi:hypothetical protein
LEIEELYRTLSGYFPKKSDLMRHLDVGACWKYIITNNSISEENVKNPKLTYFLYKKDENNLEMTNEDPQIEPDLILYFTERAILELIRGEPDAEEYFSRYRELMDNPKPPLEIDNKINKARLKLWRLGYKSWQKDFNF